MSASLPIALVVALVAGPALGQNLLVNPGFDTEVPPWDDDGSPGSPHTGSSVLWNSEDASGSPTSGSAAITGHGHGAGIWQIVRAVGGASYDISAKLNVESPPGGVAWVEVHWTAGLPNPTSTSCQGAELGTVATPVTVSQNTWETVALTVVAPAGASCGLVRAAQSNSGALNPHRMKADDVEFRRTGTTGAFHSVTPCRLVDTRLAPGPTGGPALYSSARDFPIAGNCGIPADATAVAANLTVVGPTGSGYLKAYPTGEPAPVTSALSFEAGVTKANFAVLTLGESGQQTVLCGIPGGGSTEFLLDVSGYFR